MSRMRKLWVAVLILAILVVAGCGFPTTINLVNTTSNGGQFTSIKLSKEGKTGESYVLNGKSSVPKEGQVKVTLAVDTEKGKQKIEVAFDVRSGKGAAFTQKISPRGRISSVKVSSFTYKPYEFTAKDLPMEPGVQYVYYSGKPTSPYEHPQPFPVSFNLTGPWDFSQGPTEGQLVSDSMAPKDARDISDFPDANRVIKDSSASSADTTFSKVDQGSSQQLGRSTTTLLTEAPYIYRCNPPVLNLRFPFKVGDQWSSSSQLVFSGAYSGTGSYAIASKVVSKNSVIVPQGKYDTCYLVQCRASIVDIDGSTWNVISYSWLVPNVGSVANITSSNGEQNEVFSQGTVFTRLKYKGTKMPGL
jgi:hypothetical protein